MDNKLLKAAPVVTHHLTQLQSSIDTLRTHKIVPALRVIMIGDNPASMIYTRKKAEKCKEIGLDGEVISLPRDTDTETLLSLIQKLNNDTQVHGILVQLPLPEHIDEDKVLETILPEKDVDGFHSMNIGRLQLQSPTALIPCTAKGIIALLQYYNITTEGKHVVIVGRSNIVGKPIAQLLSAKNDAGNATVTICHSRTPSIEYFTKQADIVIAAIGKPLFITQSMIKEGAVLVDVGINPTPPDSPYADKKKIVGDIDFNDVFDKASAITPVPGGIGPMTIAMLMENTVQTAILCNHIKINN